MRFAAKGDIRPNVAGGTVGLTMFRSVPKWLGPRKGCLPVSSSDSRMPKDQLQQAGRKEKKIEAYEI